MPYAKSAKLSNRGTLSLVLAVCLLTTIALALELIVRVVWLSRECLDHGMGVSDWQLARVDGGTCMVTDTAGHESRIEVNLSFGATIPWVLGVAVLAGLTALFLHIRSGTVKPSATA